MGNVTQPGTRLWLTIQSWIMVWTMIHTLNHTLNHWITLWTMTLSLLRIDSPISENIPCLLFELLHKEVRKSGSFLMLIMEIADLFIYILPYTCSFLSVFYLLLPSLLNGYVRAAETSWGIKCLRLKGEHRVQSPRAQGKTQCRGGLPVMTI